MTLVCAEKVEPPELLSRAPNVSAELPALVMLPAPADEGARTAMLGSIVRARVTSCTALTLFADEAVTRD